MKITASNRRRRKVRSKIVGVSVYPRLSIYRSNKHISAQLIDDTKGHTVAAESDITLKQSDGQGSLTGAKTAKAYAVGLALGKKILDLKIKQVVFDRGSYKYDGRVKALAQGVRESGVII